MAIFTENELMRKYKNKIKSYQNSSKDDYANFLKDSIEKGNSFCSYDLLIQILDKFAEHDRDIDTERYIDNVKQIYQKIVISEKNDVDVSVFLRLLDYYLDDYFNPDKVIDSLGMYRLFNDKSIYMGIVDEIMSNGDHYELIGFIYRVRKYYVDENALYASFLSLITRLKYEINAHKVINEYEEIARKNSGDIDVDSKEIQSAVDKLGAIYTSIEDLQKQMDVLKQDYAGMKTLTENKTKIISDEIEKAIDKATKTLSEITNSQEKVLGLHKTELNKLTESFRLRIKDLGDEYLRKINAAVSENPEAALEAFEENAIPKTPYNKFLDKSIPLSERMKMLRDNLDKNEVYHHSFFDMAEQVFLGKTPYLVGPHGVGKTESVMQFGKAIGLPIYEMGYIKDENETVLGYKDINGNYVKTNFYDVYQRGGIAFFDEVDNSLSNAFVVMDRIIQLIGYKPFLFNDGKTINPDENLLIIMGGNTWMDGTSEEYSEREQQSKTIMNRIEPIKYDNDPNVESKIMEDYSDFYEFALLYREYFKERSKLSEVSIRDLLSAKIDLENGLDVSKPLDRRFVKNLSIETLRALSTYVENGLAAKYKDQDGYENKTLKAFNMLIGK